MSSKKKPEKPAEKTEQPAEHGDVEEKPATTKKKAPAKKPEEKQTEKPCGKPGPAPGPPGSTHG